MTALRNRFIRYPTLLKASLIDILYSYYVYVGSITSSYPGKKAI